MIEANCNKCNKRSKFNIVKKNKYKCSSCDSILNKCRGNECNNMISVGLYCKTCIGKGFKEGGALIAVAGAVVGGVVIKALTSEKDNESE